MNSINRIAWSFVVPTLALTACQSQPEAPVPLPVPDGVGDCQLVFDHTNLLQVKNAPPAGGPKFNVDETEESPSLLCGLYTYHWNDRNGQPPGTIALRDQNGRVYGPYQAVATPGQGGVPNVNWNAVLPVRIELRPGTYEVIDSHPDSWSWNEDSNSQGFAKVWMRDAI